MSKKSIRSSIPTRSSRVGAANIPQQVLSIRSTDKNSTSEKQSKAGSKALCDLIDGNQLIGESLVKTGFAQIALHSINTALQERNQSSSSSTTIIFGIPNFVISGILDVLFKLVATSEQLQLLSVLINPLEKQLQQKGIESQSSITSAQKDQLLKQEREWNAMLNDEVKRLNEERNRERNENKEMNDEFIRKREEIELKNQEIIQLKDEIEKLKGKVKVETCPSQGFSISIINKELSEIDLIDLDVIMKQIYKKKQKQNTVSLTQVLGTGIWPMEAVFENIGLYTAIGIVQDSYDIPAHAHP
ncbi:MAG: hypothetical protein EZS28_002399 [Streblomastix strix]|uniref:Uncharacterized protein n=1 Tax=Streblomastix strix TaxID=222440 RepID=A0A5J4X4H1_9EUKA|nr:MAG: hypothetical protein EZS28_002399 [Streblomastix strix]